MTCVRAPGVCACVRECVRGCGDTVYIGTKPREPVYIMKCGATDAGWRALMQMPLLMVLTIFTTSTSTPQLWPNRVPCLSRGDMVYTFIVRGLCAA